MMSKLPHRGGGAGLLVDPGGSGGPRVVVRDGVPERDESYTVGRNHSAFGKHRH